MKSQALFLCCPFVFRHPPSDLRTKTSYNDPNIWSLEQAHYVLSRAKGGVNFNRNDASGGTCGFISIEIVLGFLPYGHEQSDLTSAGSNAMSCSLRLHRRALNP